MISAADRLAAEAILKNPARMERDITFGMIAMLFFTRKSGVVVGDTPLPLVAVLDPGQFWQVASEVDRATNHTSVSLEEYGTQDPLGALGILNRARAARSEHQFRIPREEDRLVAVGVSPDGKLAASCIARGVDPATMPLLPIATFVLPMTPEGQL